LARLGLRASEVLTLELDDIRWDVGEIVVRGKGRLHDRLPLLEDVGEALALYLREACGPSRSPHGQELVHVLPRAGAVLGEGGVAVDVRILDHRETLPIIDVQLPRRRAPDQPLVSIH
jgi:integrase